MPRMVDEENDKQISKSRMVIKLYPQKFYTQSLPDNNLTTNFYKAAAWNGKVAVDD